MGEEKEFDEVDFILLGILCLSTDVFAVSAMLTGVGIPLAELADKGVGAIVLIVFGFRVGLTGRVGVVNLVGTILPLATPSTLIAMWIANHPQVAGAVSLAKGKLPITKPPSPRPSLPRSKHENVLTTPSSVKEKREMGAAPVAGNREEPSLKNGGADKEKEQKMAEALGEPADPYKTTEKENFPDGTVDLRRRGADGNMLP